MTETKIGNNHPVTPPPLRWGILGTAGIARKNWRAILNSGNGAVVAVASRDAARARRFIDQCQAEAPFKTVPRALPRYDDLISAEDVQAVYVPLPTALRKPWILRAAQAGKHVICEKPCAVTTTDLQEMIETCRRHRVQFMDGVMFMHSQRFLRIGELLAEGGAAGQIRRIDSAFSFRAPPEFVSGNIRAHGDLEPHGCLGDLGWYCIRLSLWAMNGQMPLEVTGRVLSEMRHPESAMPVPAEFSGELFFAGGISAGFYCSFLSENQQWAVISGTQGYVRISDFVLPFSGREAAFDTVKSSYHIQGCDFAMEPGISEVLVTESSHGTADAQESRMFGHFAAAALSGEWNEDWPETALKTQRVMEACLRSARANRVVDLE